MRLKVSDGDLLLIRVNTEKQDAAQKVYQIVLEWTKKRGLQEVEIHAYHHAPGEHMTNFVEITVFSVNDLFESQVLNSHDDAPKINF